MSPLKRFFLICLVVFSLSFSGFLLWLSGQYTVPIMMYHSVGYADPSELNTVSPENFARQMAYLKNHGYHVLSLDELVERINSGKPFKHKSVVITFDDGYADNYTYAFNVLQKYQFPAIIFVPTDLVGTKGHLVWDQILEMANNGIDIGSHTRHHAYLPDLTYEHQRDEIFGSKQILEEKLGRPVRHFAYPIGGFSEQIKRLVKDAGYVSACATNRGYDKRNEDPYELNRIRFGNKDVSGFVLWAKLSGYYNVFRKTKSPY